MVVCVCVYVVTAMDMNRSSKMMNDKLHGLILHSLKLRLFCKRLAHVLYQR